MITVDEILRKTILVTGGAGFVGANLVRRLLAADVGHVHIVDNLLSAERSNVPDDARVRFTEGSIADDRILEGVRDEYDYIFHLSTYHGNQNSIQNPLADHEHNQLTTLKLLERIQAFRKVRKIVYSGAGCAVAEKTFHKAHATGEDAPISLQMDSPYSISKIVGELYAVYYYNLRGLPTVRARFQNVYGPGEILGAGQWRGTLATVWRNVIPTFVYRSLKGEALPLEGGGVTTRDFVYVDDIVTGLVKCALAGAPGDVYNLASGQETSILELANVINDLTGNPTPAKMLPHRDWDHSGKRFGDPEKARRLLGFEAKVELQEGLRRTIDWTRQSFSLIERCIGKHAAFMSSARA